MTRHCLKSMVSYTEKSGVFFLVCSFILGKKKMHGEGVCDRYPPLRDVSVFVLPDK